ncbi:hypothetical protein Csp2054_04705 [Curtobacterium sp. 'Ferrero']|nr:hypothetical protein Csp2054_04705 [Curtobacterium sp. 'Ferrero']
MDLQTTDGVTSMHVADAVGNPAAAIADTGATAFTVTYDPYGQESVTSGSTSAQWLQNPYGFKNGLRSSSSSNGLTKFGYRWQSSQTGGWIERDTLDAPLSPSNANRYAFAGDYPINSADPTGELSSFGTYTTQCATGALTSVGIGLGVGTSYTPQGLLVEAGLGCAFNIGSQLLTDLVPADQKSSVAGGTGYLGFLLAVAQIGKSVR